MTIDTGLGEAGTDPAAGVEVELKYRMSDLAVGERLLATDELAGFSALGPVVTVREEDRYVDTADGVLARAGYAARMRASNGHTVITLKGRDRLDTGGPTHRRRELEGPADLDVAIGDWAESPARDALASIVGDRQLEELASLRQVRRQRRYGRDEAVVMMSVDAVEVIAGDDVVERFAELEVELRDGAETALEPLAERLAEHEELVPVEGSKLERALEAVRRREPGETASGEIATGGNVRPLVRPRIVVAPSEAGPAPVRIGASPIAVGPAASADGEPATIEPAGSETPAGAGATGVAEPPVVAEPPAAAEPSAAAEPPAEEPRFLVPKSPGVLADDHLAEAGRKVLRFHLARMVAREAGTREGSEAEELHGMRVATRRQRAAWRVFGDSFDRRRTARHRRRLRRVAADLGGVRDLDVLIDAIEQYRSRLPKGEAAALEPLVQSWCLRRETARALLVRELDSDGYRRWLDGYLAFVQSEGQAVRGVGPTEPHRVRDTMPARIWAAYERVRAYESVMRWADVTTLHELRIAAKGLRYTLEFVREALGRDAGPVIAKCVALQDHLGWLHDADVAAGLARAFLVEHAGDLTEQEGTAIGRYLIDRERELARLRRTIGPPWRGVSSLAYRRALGRLVAGL